MNMVLMLQALQHHSLLQQASNASTLSLGSTVMEDAEPLPASPPAAEADCSADLAGTPCLSRPTRFRGAAACRWVLHAALESCAFLLPAFASIVLHGILHVVGIGVHGMLGHDYKVIEERSLISCTALIADPSMHG